MFGSTTVRWLGVLWLLLIGIGLFAILILIPSGTWLPEVASESGKLLLKRYNAISHLFFLLLLTATCLFLLHKAQSETVTQYPTEKNAGSIKRILQWVRRHPLASGLFAFYASLMLQQASWFYKEIISWYKDIHTDHLLNNFALRWELVKETMFRNDFRFFPLSHQDLHILSWLTPYVSIWMLVNAAELVTICILSAKTAGELSNRSNRKEILLVFSILFLFDTATGFTFFQFIYSERIVALLFAIYIYFYSHYWKSKRSRDQYLTILPALVGIFFKDTGFILFTVPPMFVLLAGCSGALAGRPKLSRKTLEAWINAYRLEICLISLIFVLAISFLFLSYIPSFYHGNNAYDSALRFSRFESDYRFGILMLTMATRSILICLRKVRFSLLDAFNIGALAYALGLFALVGFRSSNYMALPVQLIATLNLTMLWIWATTPLIHKGGNTKLIGIAGVVASSCLIGIEHLEGKGFNHRISKMKVDQESWVQTYDRLRTITTNARQNGEEINIIYSKSWFRNRGPLERLNFDRLIYFDLEDDVYTVMEGVGKGSYYSPVKGDLLVNIDTGKRLATHHIDMTAYREIYNYNPNENNGKIFRRIQ